MKSEISQLTSEDDSGSLEAQQEQLSVDAARDNEHRSQVSTGRCVCVCVCVCVVNTLPL
jgi:hypothetical protein